MSAYEGPERRLEHLTPRYTGPERRRHERRRRLAIRLTGAACAFAFVGSIGGIALGLKGEIDRATAADRAAETERRIVSCTVRGALELSAARAEERGELNDPVVLPDGRRTTTSALFAGVLSQLRDDCPPLVVPSPAEPPPPGRENVPNRFPRSG